MGRAHAEDDERKSEELTRGNEIGEGQESVPYLTDAARSLNRQQAIRRRRRRRGRRRTRRRREEEEGKKKKKKKRRRKWNWGSTGFNVTTLRKSNCEQQTPKYIA